MVMLRPRRTVRPKTTNFRSRMSQRTGEWKRKLRTQVIDKLLPTKVATGKGTRMANLDTGYEKAPHGLRGVGTVCSRPIGHAKEARLRRLVPKL